MRLGTDRLKRCAENSWNVVVRQGWRDMDLLAVMEWI
jgi:hypothetical protein